MLNDTKYGIKGALTRGVSTQAFLPKVFGSIIPCVYIVYEPHKGVYIYTHFIYTREETIKHASIHNDMSIDDDDSWIVMVSHIQFGV